MKKIFKQLLIAVLSTSLLIVFGLFLIIGVFMLRAQMTKPRIKDNTVLHIQLKGKLVERTTDFSIPTGPYIGEEDDMIDLLDLKQTIAAAQNDKKIQGIYLEVGSLQAGWASLEEVRADLLNFKQTGKFIIAYGEYYTQKTYYLAALASNIMLHPAGILLCHGLSKKVTFYKPLFKKLAIEPLVFRVGEYKSFVEPFLQDHMSKASKYQDSLWLFSIYNHFVATIAQDRKQAGEFIKQVANDLLIRTPQDALNFQLIDQIGYADEAEALIKEKLALKEKEDIRYASIAKYSEYLKNKAKNSSRNTIAILIAKGDIVDGQGSQYSIGSKSFAKMIQEIRKDKTVKAVVLRINSPGGSAMASDILWRALMLIKAEKPLIASMSDVAASGGYYLAAACDSILAHPTTLTGSIGIFGLWFDASKFFKNKVGITTDVVKTSKSAEMFNASGIPFNMARPLNNYEKKFVQDLVDNGYDTFLEKVALGRKLTKAAVAQVASGRVWTGTLAKQHGLVDKLGGLEDAIDIAAAAANLGKDYQMVYWPKSRTFFETVIGQFEGTAKATIWGNGLEEAYGLFKTQQQLINMMGIQARMPYTIDVD